MSTQWSWRDSPELMQRLNAAQNSPPNWGIDITTYAGLCGSEGKLKSHVEHYEKKAAQNETA